MVTLIGSQVKGHLFLTCVHDRNGNVCMLHMCFALNHTGQYCQCHSPHLSITMSCISSHSLSNSSSNLNLSANRNGGTSMWSAVYWSPSSASFQSLCSPMVRITLSYEGHSKVSLCHLVAKCGNYITSKFTVVAFNLSLPPFSPCR